MKTINTSCEFKEFTEEIELLKLEMPRKTNLIFRKPFSINSNAKERTWLFHFKGPDEKAICVSQKPICGHRYQSKLECGSHLKLQIL